jgi:hypothetical protein
LVSQGLARSAEWAHHPPSVGTHTVTVISKVGHHVLSRHHIDATETTGQLTQNPANDQGICNQWRDSAHIVGGGI